MRTFRLPGGDRASREPWRSAAAICWETGLDWSGPAETDWQLAREAWRRGMNAPVTTAVGRLFDAAASLAGLVDMASFEGQGPMQLEAAADLDCDSIVPLPLEKHGDEWVSDWAPLIEPLRDQAIPFRQRAALFHNSLALALVEQARAVCEETDARRVALTGGVFQNRLLTERVISGLGALGIPVDMDQVVPVNDGGLSVGQVVEYAARRPAAGQTSGPARH
jgi:hydrogenase maturation protein HypF